MNIVLQIFLCVIGGLFALKFIIAFINKRYLVRFLNYIGYHPEIPLLFIGAIGVALIVFLFSKFETVCTEKGKIKQLLIEVSDKDELIYELEDGQRWKLYLGDSTKKAPANGEEVCINDEIRLKGKGGDK